jgi:polyribonucleotide nucleotidyltransferase
MRPLFPKGYVNEVQIICTVMSINPDVDPDVVAMLGTSAALAISGLPFNGPVGCSRVGYINGEYVLNPGAEALKESDLDLVVAGTESAVLMVESEAKVLSEEVMLGAVMFGHEQSQIAINTIRELAAEVNTTPREWVTAEKDESLAEKVAAVGTAGFEEAYSTAEKMSRQDKCSAVRSEIMDEISNFESTAEEVEQITGAIKGLEKSIVRGRILDGQPRIDGRDTRTIRPITVRTGVLPRAHGSALFTRGETQALVVTTLGTERDAQIIDALEGSYRKLAMVN